MGKFEGVLLVSDFDNTLLDTEDMFHKGADLPDLPEGNRSALAYFLAEGGKFAIATGRALPSFVTVARVAPFNVPCIVANGAGIYDMQAETYLHQDVLPSRITEYVQEILQHFPTLGMEIYHPDNRVYSLNENSFIQKHQHMTYTTGQEVSDIMEVPQPFVKIVFEDTEETLKQLKDFLETCPWIAQFELVFSNTHFLELTAKGANKGGAVLRLAEHLGIDPAHIYCVGDQNNDRSMLEVAAIPFAPANCVASLRDIPNLRLLPHCQENAIAELIRILDTRYGNI